MKKVVECQRVDGVVIDENELSSLEEMIQEAAKQESVKVTQSVDSLNVRPNMSMQTTVAAAGRNSSMLNDANPISRQSMQQLAGDDNDLLSESPVFAKAKNIPTEGRISRPIDAAVPDNEPAIPVDVPEDIDDTLIQEIEDYLKGVMDNNENVIEMSDNIIKSPGANCVAAAINFCSALTEVHLSNCQIRDPGAKTIFSEVAMSKTVQVLDLSRNPITERSFDALEKMLN